MNSCKLLTSPIKIKKAYPLREKDRLFIQEQRNIAKKIFSAQETKTLLIAGPCSIHDSASTLEFAKHFQNLQSKNFHLIMRTCFEKPRSTTGWSGLVYDPFLQGKENIEIGLLKMRKLMTTLTSMRIPIAIELLNPMLFPYIDDLITYAWIGARTATSQPHKQLISSLDIPVGFKNYIDGNIEIAVQSAYSSTSPHSFIGMDQKGKACAFSSTGNPFSHVILRGSQEKSNYDPLSIQKAISLLKDYHLLQNLIVDCSHGNAQKNLEKQQHSFKSTVQQIADGNPAICGIMLECHLNEGSQKINNPIDLLYGVSITDPCLSINQLKELLYYAESLFEESSFDKASI